MSKSDLAYAALSIDGGGIRGIIPCKVLAKIEELTGEPIAELFDVVAGTSTGGILACGLNIWEEGESKPQFKAEELLDLYTGENGKAIFKQPFYGKFLNNLRSYIFRSKFKPKYLENILKKKFKYTKSGKQPKLSETHADILITSYNAQAKKPFYFKSSLAKKPGYEYEDYHLWEISRATSAAPTYFPPQLLRYNLPPKHTPKVKLYDMEADKMVDKVLETKELNLLDGGVFANNPSMLAFIETRKKWMADLQAQGELNQTKDNIQEIKETLEKWKASGKENELNGIMKNLQKMMDEVKRKPRGMTAEKIQDDGDAPILLVSIGTGQSRKPYSHEKTRGIGQVKWIKKLIDILMQGVSESVHYQMKYLLPNFTDDTPRYMRFNIELHPDHAEMDDVSDASLERLQLYGDKLVEENILELETLSGMLLEIKDAREARKKRLQEIAEQESSAATD